MDGEYEHRKKETERLNAEPAEDQIVAEERESEPEPHRRGFLATFREAFRWAQQARPRPANKRSELSRDRTKAFFALAAGVVVVIFVFLGMFSSPSGQNRPERNRQGQPNLGRPKADPNLTESTSGGSVTPLLSAETQNQRDPYGNPLTPEDIRGTSRRVQRETDVAAPQEASAVPSLSQVDFSDPALEAYGRRESPPPAPPSVPNPPSAHPVRDESEELAQSSLVFVRTVSPQGTQSTGTRPAFAEPKSTWAALPPGTRLVARLQSAVSTAVKSPAVAVIEYNYERYGQIVVPAGAKAFGDLEQASSSGHVGIRFHTLSMPDGREEKIQGAALALDFGPIKGKVSGRNRGKRILVRSLTGIGSMAAFLVGGRGGFSGLSGPLNQSALLRERIASNVAIAGEQELTRLAFNQNIVVTVPGNLRFYIVLEEGAIEGHRMPESLPATGLRLTTGRPEDEAAIPSVTELRELMALRRELNRMYRDTANASDEERQQHR